MGPKLGPKMGPLFDPHNLPDFDQGPLAETGRLLKASAIHHPDNGAHPAVPRSVPHHFSCFCSLSLVRFLSSRLVLSVCRFLSLSPSPVRFLCRRSFSLSLSLSLFVCFSVFILLSPFPQESSLFLSSLSLSLSCFVSLARFLSRSLVFLSLSFCPCLSGSLSLCLPISPSLSLS